MIKLKTGKIICVVSVSINAIKPALKFCDIAVDKGGPKIIQTEHIDRMSIQITKDSFWIRGSAMREFANFSIIFDGLIELYARFLLYVLVLLLSLLGELEA